MNNQATIVPFDPTNAPPGFYAVSKATVPHDRGNLCQFCEWRPECQRSGDADDRLCEKHHCMGYEVIVYKRLQIIDQL